MISYKKFFEKIKEKEITVYKLEKEKIISKSAIQRMRHNEYVTLKTIDELCRYLNCQPSDLLEYVEENKEDTMIKEF